MRNAETRSRRTVEHDHSPVDDPTMSSQTTTTASSNSNHHQQASAVSTCRKGKHWHHHHTINKQSRGGGGRRVLLLRLVWLLATMGLLYTWQQYQTHRHLHDMVQSALQERMDDHIHNKNALFTTATTTRSSSNIKSSNSNSSRTSPSKTALPASPSTAAESASSSSVLPVPDWVIFYNIFIPNSRSIYSNSNNTTNSQTTTDPAVENAKRIVMEQIDMIRRSFAGGAGGDAVHNSPQQQPQQQERYQQPVQLFYNTIGNGHVITPAWMHELCTRQQQHESSSSSVVLPILDCHFLQHYDEAFEEVTLQKLYEHCQSNDNDNSNDDNRGNSRVVYLHSKGSYHDHADRRNEHWRRHGTLAATSRDCIHPPLQPSSNNSSSNTCNLCGLQFWTYWVHFMPGNFWTAQCSYIQKLLPPMDFMHRINDVSSEAMLWTLQGKFSQNMMFSGRNDHFGIDRFASEHWVGSHPDLIPCDVSPSTTGFGHWISGGGPPQGKQAAFEFGMAPRRDGSPVGEEVKTRPVILKNKTLRKKEFFLLPGRLFKWMRLYQKAPPKDSWIWKWYPDGEYWKDAVERYGNETLDIVLGGGDRRSRGGGVNEYHDADIAPATTRDNIVIELAEEQSPKWAIFHHIVVPTIQQQEHQQSVAKQLDSVSQSYAANSEPGKPVTIFYNAVRQDGTNVTGNDKEAQDAMEDLCRDQNRKTFIRCQPIPQQQYQPYSDKDDRSLDTLQSLMAFCKTHDSWRVVYMHSNHNDDDYSTRTHQEIMAATSAACLESSDITNDDCNLCGLQSSTQPAIAMEGNTFAAKCEYINKLVPPRVFEAQMQNLAKQALLMRAQEKFHMTLFQEVGMEHFGIGKFASQHWVGSHPQVKPCHVLPKDATAAGGVAEKTQDRIQAFSLSTAPQVQTSIQPEGWAPNTKRQLDLNRLKRVPEYFYLLGRLFKWQALYNETPSESSWVWDHFPDGKEWKQAIAKFGQDVVNQVLAHPPLLFGSSPDSTNLRVDVDTSPGWVIFYNVYIPTSEQEVDVERGLRIFEEQIQQVRDSYAASVPGKPVTVFYNTIGKAVNQTFFDGICSLDDLLICKHMAHYDEGDEGLTEQALWDYCKIEEHSQHRAVYIHSKGSYHGWEANDFWRRHSTNAVTSEECLNPPDKSCNICGLQFYPVWNIFFPGNFWAGQCKYVAKLISPDDFPRRLEEMAVQLRKYEKEQRLFANKLYDHGLPWANGADRYAWEIWSGTHPSINPCDVSVTADHDHWRTQGNRTKDEFVWSMGPRHATLEGPWLMLEKKRRASVLDKFGLRMRDYFLLPGNLVKWFALYNEAPPDSSWVWNWFPDGKTWKRAVQTHGTLAFEKMTDRWDKSLVENEAIAPK